MGTIHTTKVRGPYWRGAAPSRWGLVQSPWPRRWSAPRDLGDSMRHMGIAQLGVSELALGEGATARLARLRADTGLKLPDCCVLAAAQRFQGAVASFDAELLGAAGGLGLETLGSERKSYRRRRLRPEADRSAGRVGQGSLVRGGQPLPPPTPQRGSSRRRCRRSACRAAQPRAACPRP